MDIPFFTKAIEARRTDIKLKEQQIEINKKDIELKSKLGETVMAMTTQGHSMSDELYGGGNGYKTGHWALPVESLQRLSRIAYWESTEAQALIDRFVQVVVGKGLTLQSQPAWRMIPRATKDDDARKDIVENIEIRWKIYANSKKSHWLNVYNVDQMVSRSFFSYLYNGEYFLIFRYRGNGQRNPVTAELIAPENIQMTTSKPARPGGIENEVDRGIEYDARGRAVAYHVLTKNGNSTRIEAVGSRSGRTIVIHKYNQVNESQRRGVPMLSGSINELTKMGDAKALEIQAMVINALFAVWIKPSETEGGQITIGGAVGKKTVGQQNAASIDAPGYNSKLEDANFDRGGIVVEQMPAGHEMHSFDTKRPNIDVMKFIDEVKKSIYRAKGMSPAVADYDFAQQYSAARGELIVFYERVMQMRKDIPAELMSEWYKMWLWSENDRPGNDIDLPGYENEEIRDAWSHALWKGSQRPDIDPKKSAEANVIETRNGWKDNQMVTVERDGGDFNENLKKLKTQMKELSDVRAPIIDQEQTNFNFSENTSIVEEDPNAGEGGGNE